MTVARLLSVAVAAAAVAALLVSSSVSSPVRGASLVSALGVRSTGKNTGVPEILFTGGKPGVQVNISSPASQASFLKGTFAAAIGSYLLVDYQNRVYTVNPSTGAVGEIVTLDGVNAVECVTYDEVTARLIVVARDGVFVVDPRQPKPERSIAVYAEDVPYCSFDSGTGDLLFLQQSAKNTIFAVNTRKGSDGTLRKIGPVTPAPLSVDAIGDGRAACLAGNVPWHEWGGSASLNAVDLKSGANVGAFNFSFPEGGAVPAAPANAVVPTSATDDHVVLVSIMDDDENGFVCSCQTGIAPPAAGGKDVRFTDMSGTFAVFGMVRPNAFTALAVIAKEDF